MKRLGVNATCDGRWTKEYARWIQTATIFGQKLMSARVDRLSGYLAYHSIWVAKVWYSAAVIGFTTNQMNKIQQKIIGQCLSVAGYCRTILRAVVYGIRLYGGMEWEHIPTLYLFEKLKILIGSIRKQDKLGRMIMLQLLWINLL